MTKILVGHTGFVGSNLVISTKFDGIYNSKNIDKAFGLKPDLLIYAGVRSEKFLANKYPKDDYLAVSDAIENIKRINPKKIVLISTVDVYKAPIDVDEDTLIDTNELHPYGLNRYLLEKWIELNIKEHLIIRLPGLYGENIKKNFIFDFINVIPSIITEDKYCELSKLNFLITKSFYPLNNGFYKCAELSVMEREKLIQFFNKIGFSALNFTDSRGVFQFYNLAYLWKHISMLLGKKIKKINFATEPIVISELYYYLKKQKFVNEIASEPPIYNFKTKYACMLGDGNEYIFSKDFILKDIKNFINRV